MPTIVWWFSLSDEKNKEIFLTFILDKAFRKEDYSEIGRLQIIKICFLIDKLFSEHKLSTSGYEYILERLGPYSDEIIKQLDKMVYDGKIQNGSQYYNYLILNLPEKIKEVEKLKETIVKEKLEKEIDQIFELAKDVGLLLDYVHGLPEVKSIEMGKKIYLY
ncbi:MAG: hypothetical protein PHD95_03155 [Candidatus ainarchaeum sp.]|nr:hypothetical protein [Candidatus ainarchaeum sp.]